MTAASFVLFFRFFKKQNKKKRFSSADLTTSNNNNKIEYVIYLYLFLTIYVTVQKWKSFKQLN